MLFSEDATSDNKVRIAEFDHASSGKSKSHSNITGFVNQPARVLNVIESYKNV